LSCKNWEKLKLILPFLVRGREREEKGKEEEKRAGTTILCPQKT